MVMMKLMKPSAHRIPVEDNSVHQIFQHRPDRDAQKDQMEAIYSSQVQENQDSKRYGDEVAEVSNSPHHLGRQARNDSCSPHWITSPALSSGFSSASWTCRLEIGTDLHDDVAVVGQTVEQRNCHLGVAEHAGPL